jgi:glutamate-1-semialdehyde 2,1-aminomutase
MAAGLTLLNILNNNPQIYQSLEQKGSKIAEGMRKSIKEQGLNYTVNQIGSMVNIFFTDKKVENFEDALTCDTALFGKYFHAMLNRGIYIAPAQFESWFLSNALSDEDVNRIIEANDDALREIHA